MAGWLKNLFNRYNQPAPGDVETQEGWSYHISSDSDFENNKDIVSGVTYFATLHLTNTLCALKHHGEFFDGPPGKAPVYGNSQNGIWIPKTRSWRELGIAIDEFPETEAASDIGQILPSVYVPFLIRFREIVESDAPTNEKRALISDLQTSSSEFSTIWERITRAYGDFPRQFLG